MDDTLASLARNGRLRAAINLGNRALVQQAEGELRGVSPALARLADAGRDSWDVDFLAIDATRAETVAFTRPYLTIEAIYAVRADSPLREVDDVDRPGRAVFVAAGCAYQRRSPTPGSSATAPSTRRPASVSIEGRSGPSNRRWSCRVPATPRVAALDDFVARAIAERFVAANTG